MSCQFSAIYERGTYFPFNLCSHQVIYLRSCSFKHPLLHVPLFSVFIAMSTNHTHTDKFPFNSFCSKCQVLHKDLIGCLKGWKKNFIQQNTLMQWHTHTHTHAHLLDLITSVHYSDLFIFFITLLCLGFYSNLIHLIFSHINVLMTKWKHAPLFSWFLLQFLNVNSSLCVFYFIFFILVCF